MSHKDDFGMVFINKAVVKLAIMFFLPYQLHFKRFLTLY